MQIKPGHGGESEERRSGHYGHTIQQITETALDVISNVFEQIKMVH